MIGDDTFAVVLWTTIAVGWIGFLIILAALGREAYGALRSARGREEDGGS